MLSLLCLTCNSEHKIFECDHRFALDMLEYHEINLNYTVVNSDSGWDRDTSCHARRFHGTVSGKKALSAENLTALIRNAAANIKLAMMRPESTVQQAIYLSKKANKARLERHVVCSDFNLNSDQGTCEAGDFRFSTEPSNNYSILYYQLIY